MKLLASTKTKIAKDKNGKNVSCFEITELVLIHCNVVNNTYQQNSRACIHLLLINLSFSY